METKTIFPRKNNVNVTGTIVKEDAYINAAGTFASFRIAHSKGQDRQSLFLDVVMFARDNAPIPTALLKRGTKVEVNGLLDMHVPPVKEGEKAAAPRLRIVATTVTENKAVEVEVTKGNSDDLPDTFAPAPADDDLGIPDEL